MRIHVFLGPSLPLAEARRALPEAVFHPPAAMGDVVRLLLDERPRAIGLVDGLFEQTPAVWHKELLFAMARGTPVLGAASMGALRAAELSPFGMVGVGSIFEAYRDGALEDDDEVAVAHGPVEDGCRVLSVAMVNVRHGLALAGAEGLVSERTARELVLVAKSTYYAERTWTSLLRDGAARGLPRGELQALEGFLRRERPDLKGEDARSLLRALGDPERLAEAAPPAFHFECTTFFRRLVASEVASAAVARGSAEEGRGDRPCPI